MKEVILKISGGEVKIHAEGAAGQGTASFTEGLAKDLGKIEERHKGMDHAINTEKPQVKQGNS
jgi:hypothetical protein